ncbi:MAG: holo-ACP synthase [Clostridia bacterium]|nr:holo-ACP synthase [Clostridia bacterium]
MLGVDTVRISRVREAVRGEAFRTRVFTADEIKYCDGAADAAASYAGIFCAKEAVAKALGTGFGRGVMPHDIEITHAETGAPVAVLRGEAARMAGGREAEISVSHDGDHAVAVAMIANT